MGIGEAGLVAAIVFHAFNGIRIIPGRLLVQGPPRYQRTMLWVVVGLFVVTMAGFPAAPPDERLRGGGGALMAGRTHVGPEVAGPTRTT